MPSHVEIPAKNVFRARQFYTGLFGWEFEKTGTWEYWQAGTPAAGVSVGLFQKKERPQPVADAIRVDSIDACLRRIEALGGKILVPKTGTQGWGFYAVFQDTEDNVFELWEPEATAGG